MQNQKKAFTLLEVLISIMLLSLVLMALYRSADILRASNKNLFHHLEHSSDSIKGMKTLYMDIIQANTKVIIDTKKKFHRITIEKSQHSLYGLGEVKITWLIYKEKNSLIRIEGTNYKLPLHSEDNVAIDKIATDIEIFKSYMDKKNKKILVISKIAKEEPQNLMIQNLSIPPSIKVHKTIDIIGGSRNTKKHNK